MLNVILGGDGLIGSALNEELLSRNEETVVFDLKQGFDLRDKKPPNYPGPVFYWFVAWDVGGANYIMDPECQVAILRNNLRLCETVFTWLQERRAQFVFVSTQMVQYPNAYGLSKAVGEYWTELLGEGQTARLWNVYGPEAVSQRSHLIPDLIVQSQTGAIQMQTSGVERRQFLHSKDCARALIALRESKCKMADITSGKWIEVGEVASTIGRLTGAKVKFAKRPGYESLIEPTALLPGWRPTIDLDSGIADVMSSMRSAGWLDTLADVTN